MAIQIENSSKVVVRLRIIRLDVQCLPIKNAGLREPALAEDNEAEIVVCHPAIRIASQGCSIERVRVDIRPALKPGQCAEHGDHPNRRRSPPPDFETGKTCSNK